MKNEVRVNVLNQPYGGFPWIDLPMAANRTGTTRTTSTATSQDLDAATLEDVRQFFKTFYAPNNAVLVVAGDFDAGADARRGSRSTSRRMPRAPQPAPPDLTEPRQEPEKRDADDRPARRRGRRSASPTTCPRATRREWYAFGLHRPDPGPGRATRRLYDELVRKRGADRAASAPASTSASATCSTTTGPMLWIAQFFHDAGTPADALVQALDAAVERLQSRRRSTRRRSTARSSRCARSLYAEHRAVRGLRARQPARLVRALRRRPGAHQPRSRASSRRSRRRCCRKRRASTCAAATARSTSSRPGPRPARRAGSERRRHHAQSDIADTHASSGRGHPRHGPARAPLGATATADAAAARHAEETSHCPSPRASRCRTAWP